MKSTDSAIEYIFVRVVFNNNPVVFGVFYRPPNVTDISNLPDDAIDIISRYGNVVLMGDFNHDIASGGTNADTTNFWNSLNMTLVHNK